MISKMISNECRYTNGYRLSLSNGISWWIGGDNYSLQWLSKLAKIMQIEGSSYSNDSYRMIFKKMEDIPSSDDRMSVEAYLSGAQSWRLYRFRTIRIWQHNDVPNVVCELTNNGDIVGYANMCYSLIPIYNWTIKTGGLPFHSGLVERDGLGILLAGSGGTGKSTCCRRIPSPWRALSDDEALIVLDRQGKYRAHPFPTWSEYIGGQIGRTWNVQYSVPIAGIFFIAQSDMDEAIPIGKGKSAVRIAESANQVYRKFPFDWDKQTQIELSKNIFDNACRLAKAIPAFILNVNLTGKFWEEIDKALKLS